MPLPREPEPLMRQGNEIAVTGATGFLGSRLTERLLNSGKNVRILARDPAKAERFDGAVARTVVGQIGDPKALAELMEGADTVFHLVSNFCTASDSPATYRKVNLEGTVAALEAARQ